MQKTEQAIQSEILLALGSRPDVRLWRQNTGVAVPLNTLHRALKTGQAPIPVRYGVPGQADLSGIVTIKLVTPGVGLRIGLRLEVEIKKPGGRQMEDQKAFMEMVLSRGGIYILARSVEEATAALESAIARVQHMFKEATA